MNLAVPAPARAAERKIRHNPAFRNVVHLLTGLPATLVILLLWQWFATANQLFFLPAPADIVARVDSDWLSGPVGSMFLTDEGASAIGQTFGTALGGWAIAAVLGIVIGSLMGVRRGVADVAGPPLLLLRSVPPIAIIPIAIVVLGLGGPMRATVVVVGCIWPILLNSVSAVSGVDPVLRDVATLYRLTPVGTFRRILIPAASPKIFAGLRVALSLAIVLAVGSDMFAGTGGIGGVLLTSQNSFDVPGLWAAIAVLAILGAGANGLLLLIEQYALRWNHLGEKS